MKHTLKLNGNFNQLLNFSNDYLKFDYTLFQVTNYSTNVKVNWMLVQHASKFLSALFC